MDALPEAILRLVLKQVITDQSSAESARQVCKLWAAEILSLVTRVSLTASDLPGPSVPSLAPLARLTALEELLVTKATIPVDLAPVATLQQLSQLTLDTHNLEVSSLSVLVRLRQLTFNVAERLPDGIAALAALESLHVTVVRVAPEISFLTALVQLDTLEMQCDPLAMPQLPDLDPCVHLRTLKLENCALSPFPVLPSGLTALHLAYPRYGAVLEIPMLRVPLPQLRHLLLSACKLGRSQVRILLAKWCPRLEKFTAQHCPSPFELGGLSSLQSLEYGGLAVAAISGLEHLSALKSLWVKGLPFLSSLQGLQRATALETLTVKSCESLTSLPALGALTRLRALQLRDLESLEALPQLSQLHQLSALQISLCGELSSIPGLGKLSGLRDLRLEHLDGLTTLAGLDQLTSLTVLCLQLWTERLVLVNAGVVQIFNRLLNSGGLTAKQFAAASLSQLTLDEESKAVLNREGGLMRLVEMLEPASGNEEVVVNAAHALCNVCWNGDNESGTPNEAMARAVVAARAVPTLLHMFGVPKYRYAGLVGLTNLTILPDARAEIMAAGVHEKLMASILDSTEIGFCELSTLAQFCLDEGCAKMVREDWPLFEKVLKLAKTCGNGGNGNGDDRRRFANDILRSCGAEADMYIMV